MNILIIDTETANCVEQPLPYDIGYQIVNTFSGEVLVARSFVVAEIFLDKELMKEAYFAEKIPQYWEEIKSKKRTLKRFINIRKILWRDMKQYQVTKVGAYNMGFDKRATNNDTRFITASFLRWFFPYNTTFFCIWNMACTSILKTPAFISFAERNNFISDFGNIQTSAEIVYRFITNNPGFIEEHTGLEDVDIERQIFLKIYNSGLSYDDTISYNCWRKVQKYRKELKEGEYYA